MGLCYFCNANDNGSWFSSGLCDDCKKLQSLTKAIGANKLVHSIRLKIKNLD